VSDWRDGERDDREEQPAPPPARREGVRILGAEEAQTAIETGQAAGRLDNDTPRFGDVPARPAPPVRPAARFPLPSEWTDEPGQPEPSTMPASGDTWSATAEGTFAGEAETHNDEPAEIETSGQVELPHWTDPPTGEVPVILPEAEPVDITGEEDLDAWAPLTGHAPRFRSQAGDWSEGDFATPDALKDESTAVGALADQVDDDEEFHESLAARRREGGRGMRQRPTTGAPQTPDRDFEFDFDLEDEDDEGAAREPAAGSDLALRVVTGVAIAVVCLLFLSAGRGWATVLVAGIVGVATFELLEGFRKAGFRVASIIGVLGAVTVVGAAYKLDNGLQAFPLVTTLVVVFSMLWYFLEVVRARATVNIAMTLLGFVYVGFLSAFAALMLQYPDGVGMIIGLAICAVGYDVAGYVVGSRLGRTPLAPSISPHKTVEGLVAGMLAAFVLGGIVSKGFGLAPWDGSLSDGLALGVVVAILAPLGDLCESMIKRDLGVKDLGTFLPGHGGILDRFDAILFCLPAVYYLVIYLGLH
jgi:phosphatidate cytidylyltransferase